MGILNTKLMKSVMALSAILFSASLQAQEMPEGYYDFELSSVEVIEDVVATEEHQDLMESSCSEPISMDALDKIIDLNRILHVGTKVWKIIKENQPVLEAEGATAHAVPYGVTCWETLANWKYPKSKSYRYRYKNAFGLTVVDVQFKVTYTPQGQYKGRGSYLSNVSIFPEKLMVAWGYSVNASATTLEPVNMGTELFPVAGMEAQISWLIETPLKHMQSTNAIFVTGLGNIRQL